MADTKNPASEKIDERILRLLGLENEIELSYGEYVRHLKEALSVISLGKSRFSSEEAMLLQQEFKRVKSKKKENRFKPKSTKSKINASNISGLKSIKPGKQKGIALLSGSKVEDIKKDKTAETLASMVSAIRKSVESIENTLTKQIELDTKSAEVDRRNRENQKRSQKESKLETVFKGLASVAKKVIEPVKSLFDRLLRFIVFTLLGRAFTMFMNWASDPKNADKVKSLGRFLKDWWPTLLGAWFLFATPLGRFTRTIIGSVAKLTFQLTKFAIPRLFKFARRNPKTALALGGAALMGANAMGAFSNDEEREGYARGGSVNGPQGTDKVPAMLTQGEFVISKGAVDKFGADFFASLNAAGGGTNQPRVMGGNLYAATGGPVGRTPPEGKSIVSQIKDFIKYKLGYDVDKPQTWGPSFSKGIGQMGQGLASQGQGLAKGLASQGQGLLNQSQSYLKGDRLQKDVSTLMQSGTQFGAGLYDQALKVGNQALSSIQSGGIQKKAAEVAQGAQALPKKAGAGFFDTFKKMGSLEIYQKGASKMEKAQDTMINLGDKFISKLPDGPFKDVADKGLIPIPSGNATTMRNLTFIKAMLGPIGKPFKILSNKEVDAMRQKTIEKTMGKSGLIVDPKTGQVKMNWNQEDINKGARGGGAYTDDLGPRGSSFNSVLGRFTASTKGKGNTLYTDDRYNFNKTVGEYAEMAKQGLMKGSMNDAGYYGLSMLGRFAQDIGWLNQRALGSEIEIGKIDRSKLDPKTGKMKSAQQIAAEKSKADKKKYGQSVTMYGANDPRKKQAGPYKSKFARPAQGKTSTPSKKPQRAWFDPRGWVGKQGGGLIGESTGFNIPGATADRQMVPSQPGEYMFPVDSVQKLGVDFLDKLVALTDSNSNAFKSGAAGLNIPGPMPSSGTGGMINLPPITQTASGSQPGGGGSTKMPDFMATSSSETAMQEREISKDIYGIVG